MCVSNWPTFLVQLTSKANDKADEDFKGKAIETQKKKKHLPPMTQTISSRLITLPTGIVRDLF